MRKVNGWRLYEYAAFKTQKAKLEASVAECRATSPQAWRSLPDAKLLKAIQHLIDVAIPADPNNKQFRQGDTLGSSRKHWFRAKFGNGRYRLFFQFNSVEKAIIYAWVNDNRTLRTYGAKMDAYEVFKSMIGKGDPPDSWQDLAKAVGARPNVKLKPGTKKKQEKPKARRR